jgi:hypothetical protein
MVKVTATIKTTGANGTLKHSKELKQKFQQKLKNSKEIKFYKY